jgi:O-antigen ligase
MTPAAISNYNRSTGFFSYMSASLLCVYIYWSYIRGVNAKLMLVVILVSLVMQMISARHFVFHLSKYQFLFAAIIFLSSVGALYSSNASSGLRFVMQLCLAFAVYTLIVGSQDLLGVIFRVTCISGMVAVLAILLQVAFPDWMLQVSELLIKTDAYAMTRTLYSYNYYTGLSGFNCLAGFYAASMLGVFGILSLKETRIAKRLLFAAFAFISLFALIATQKRGVFLSAVIAFFFAMASYYLFKRNYRKILQFLLIILLVGTAVYIVMNQTEAGAVMLKRFHDSANFMSGRDDIYEALLSGIWQNPLLGHGTGSMYSVYDGAAHNIYLQILYDHGAIGLLLYVGFFLTPLIRGLSHIRAGRATARFYISVYIQVLFLCYGMTGNPLYDFCLFILYLLFVLMTESDISHGMKVYDATEKENCDSYLSQRC